MVKPVQQVTRLQPDPTPAVARARVHLFDAMQALKRADEAWNSTQFEDALASAERFIGAMRHQLK